MGVVDLTLCCDLLSYAVSFAIARIGKVGYSMGIRKFLMVLVKVRRFYALRFEDLLAPVCGVSMPSSLFS